jgi:hypothetical protein
VKATRLTALVLLGGALAGGLVLQAAERDDPASPVVASPVVAGVAMPAAMAPGTLSSTWYCAGGSATDGGVADHVLLVANPTDAAVAATITVIPGGFAPPATIPGDGSTTTTAPPATTTTTVATTTTAVPAPEPQVVEIAAHSRLDVPLSDLVDAPLAGAIVEAAGAPIVVDHQVTSEEGGRATAPCSTTAATSWTFPWGVTSRGARELLVFMNPFPDDASLDIAFATDEGARDTLRFRNFVVPGRSVVGAYIDDPGGAQRQAQVSAQVNVRSGRLVVDRIQIFGSDDDDDLEGITLGLGAPVPAETWIFPDGNIAEGVREQIVVFNPSEDVAEVEVELRLDDPETNAPPEPYELTVLPGRFSIIDLPDPLADPAAPPRVPLGVAHTSIVRSLNGVAIAAERVIIANAPNSTLGVGATLGSPLLAPTWYFAAGGIIPGERDEFLTLFNGSLDEIATFSVSALADGQLLPLADLQDGEIAPGGRVSIRMSEHSERERLPIVVTADGPIVAERGLYRINGRGISQSMGIPLAVDVVVPDPVEG